MWLASISLRDKRDEPLATGSWTPRQQRHAMRIAEQVLAGAGNEGRERRFRMCSTLCIHRAIREDELAEIPQWWHQAEAVDIAGGPLEVLSSVGVEEIASCQPCYDPGHQVLNKRRPDLYIPVDCGMCPPCMARKAVRTRGPLATAR